MGGRGIMFAMCIAMHVHCSFLIDKFSKSAYFKNKQNGAFKFYDLGARKVLKNFKKYVGKMLKIVMDLKKSLLVTV